MRRAGHAAPIGAPHFRTCVPLPSAGGDYRVVEVRTVFPGETETSRPTRAARVHLAGTTVLGLERDE